jgi:uncharacterized membrane protein YeaQ/YmgE (transglycosylase-associated protein family)
MILAIIGYIIFGLIVGLIARLLMPGRDPMGLVATTLLGIAGSFVGGLLARALFNDNNGVGWIGAIIGAMLLLLLYRAVTSRRRGYLA